MRRVVQCPIFALVLSSCAPSPAPLALPEVDGMASALVVVERIDPDFPGEVLRVLAIDLATPFTDDHVLETPADTSEPRARVTALFYATRLSALGFPTGELAEAEPGRPGRRFPMFDAAFQLEITGSKTSAWQAIDALSRELAGFRLAGEAR